MECFTLIFKHVQDGPSWCRGNHFSDQSPSADPSSAPRFCLTTLPLAQGRLVQGRGTQVCTQVCSMVEASHILARVWEIRCVRQVNDGASWIRRHADQVTLSHRRAGCFWTAAQPAVRVLSNLSNSKLTDTSRAPQAANPLIAAANSFPHGTDTEGEEGIFVSKVCALSLAPVHSTGQQTDVTVRTGCMRKEKRKRGAASGVDPRKRLDGCYQRTIKTQSCCNNLPRLPQKASPLT